MNDPPDPVMREAFEALCAAMEHQPGAVQVRRATAFWRRLGDAEAREMALDAIALAQAMGSNPAGDCMAQAREAGHTAEAIADAALFAARS